MASRHNPIIVEPGSELDRALESADDAPLELEWRGVRYQVVRAVTPAETTDIWEGYDPKRANSALAAAAGGWVGLIDSEALKAYISERRRTANRPSVAL